MAAVRGGHILLLATPMKIRPSYIWCMKSSEAADAIKQVVHSSSDTLSVSCRRLAALDRSSFALGSLLEHYPDFFN